MILPQLLRSALRLLLPQMGINRLDDLHRVPGKTGRLARRQPRFKADRHIAVPETMRCNVLWQPDRLSVLPPQLIQPG